MGRVRLSTVVLAIVAIGSLTGCSFGTGLLGAIRGMQQLVAINEDFDYAVGAAARNSYAFVLDKGDQDQGTPPVMKTVNLSVPTTPAIVGFVELPSTTGAAGFTLALEGSHLYVVCGDLFIIDVTNPEDPVILGSYSSLEPFKELALDVDSGIAVLSPGFQVVDVSDPGSIVTLGSLPDLGDEACWGLAVDGDTVFAIDDGNICVVDISDPSNPTVVNGAGFSADNHYTDINAPEPNTLLAIGLQQGLDVLDTTTLTDISLISHLEGDFYSLFSSSRGTAFVGRTAEVATTCAGFIELSDLENPQTTGNYNMPPVLGGHAMGLAEGSGYVVVPYFDLGLAVFSK